MACLRVPVGLVSSDFAGEASGFFFNEKELASWPPCIYSWVAERISGFYVHDRFRPMRLSQQTVDRNSLKYQFYVQWFKKC
jgi:hypothetical protein